MYDMGFEERAIISVAQNLGVPGILLQHGIYPQNEYIKQYILDRGARVGEGLGSVGVGPDQLGLTVPQGGEIDRHPSGHADEDHPAPGTAVLQRMLRSVDHASGWRYSWPTRRSRAKAPEPTCETSPTSITV